MAIEDFEWEGEVELTEPRHAGQKEPTESWLTRVRKSVWLEPLLRLGGMAALLGVLAVIGVVATTYAKPGIELTGAPLKLADAFGTSWLKPTQNSEKDRTHAHTQAPGPTPLAQLPAVLPSVAPSVAATSSSAAAGAPAVPAAPAPSGVMPDGRVVLNAASAEELTRLPGVGMKRAEAIVALRTKLKRFKQATDLLRVKGIGPRGLKRMLPHLVLDAP
jgi:competence protein ComEA